MSALLHVAWRSAMHRRFGLLLVAFTVALSTFLLLTVERVRHDVRTSFQQSISGTDLIVGARTGQVQLLLYAVFRIGNATAGMRWSSVQALEADRAVAWVVPIALGDTHRGFPVVGTRVDYFEHLRYGDRQALRFAQGQAFADVFDAVLGAEVAHRLSLRVGDRITLSHGGGEMPGTGHDDKPFTVVGILAATGTPVDRSVHIGLDGMEALHADWLGGMPMPGRRLSAEQVRERDLTPRSVTAALVGLKSRAAVFSLQRRVSELAGEPLMAILPGVALDELWDAVGMGERALLAMGAVVAVVSLAGLVAVVVTGLEQRRRELAVLRAVGAGPRHVVGLLLAEGVGITVMGALVGCAAFLLATAAAGPWMLSHAGVTLRAGLPSASEWALLGAVVAAGSLASLVPGWRAYHLSLSDGLTPRA